MSFWISTSLSSVQLRIVVLFVHVRRHCAEGESPSLQQRGVLPDGYARLAVVNVCWIFVVCRVSVAKEGV